MSINDLLYAPVKRTRVTLNGTLLRYEIEVEGQVIDNMIDTADDEIQQALIALGWTPPGHPRLIFPA